MDDQRAVLEKLQAEHDKRKAEIETLQKQIREAELVEQAEAHLDSLPSDERGVLINVAAIRIGADAGKPKV